MSFITIDEGGDDTVGCGLHGTIDVTCANNGRQAVQTNMPIILAALRAAAGPNVPIVGMTYYDPFLALYTCGLPGVPLTGHIACPQDASGAISTSEGQALARESVPLTNQLDAVLTAAYSAGGAKVADVKQAFQTDDWGLTGSFMGLTLPQNVANMCNNEGYCGGPNGTGAHLGPAGYVIIARTFEKQLEQGANRLP